MRIVNFLGGLGNQMFIYALYQHLKTVYPDESIYGCYKSGSLDVHYGLEIEKVFDVSLPPSTIMTDILVGLYRFCKRIGLTNWENDRNFTKYDIVFDGYWLDKFFYNRKDVKELFRFRNTELSAGNKKILNLIKSSDSVSLHVHRGDYQTSENVKLFGRFCDNSYYRKAVDTIVAKVANPKFFVFSDDIEWVRNNMELKDVFYVDINKGTNSYIDMYLMSRCKHSIMANSTFSYWAAMLKVVQGIVIYPKKWYYWENPDIFPDEWMPL